MDVDIFGYYIISSKNMFIEQLLYVRTRDRWLEMQSLGASRLLGEVLSMDNNNTEFRKTEMTYTVTTQDSVQSLRRCCF